MLKNSFSGMTLVELLVALISFVLIVGVIVVISGVALETWRQSEYRKDIYQRARRVISQIEEDIKNIFVEDATPSSDRLPAYLICDYDKKGRQIIRFVRSVWKPTRIVQVQEFDLLSANTFLSNLQEVCYVMDEKDCILWRASKPFTRLSGSSFFNKSPAEKYLKKVEEGVVHLHFLFWTQNTNTWDTKYKPRRKLARGKSGPSLVWDSTRVKVKNFIYFYKQKGLTDYPSPVYPPKIRVFMVIESRIQEYTGTKLYSNITSMDKKIPLLSTRDLPDPPNYIKIGQELIEYEKVETTCVIASKRGALGTRPSHHKAGMEVHFGKIFTYDIFINTYRDVKE
jgi:type II secretory pathway pseudopilin PulG